MPTATPVLVSQPGATTAMQAQMALVRDKSGAVLQGFGANPQWCLGGRLRVSATRVPAMAYEQQTQATDQSVLAFLNAVEPVRRRQQGLELLALFVELTQAQPVMWGPSMVGFGQVRYTYASGHSGEMFQIGFSPRKAALTLYGLTTYGSNADLLADLGKHRVGKGCLYINKLEDVDLGVLRELIRRGWTDDSSFLDSHPDAVVERLDDSASELP